VVRSNSVRASGFTAAQETAEAITDSDEETRDNDGTTATLDTEIEMSRIFRTPGFQRMRIDWNPEDAIILTQAKVASEKRLLVEFPDTYQLMNQIFDKVRKPAVDTSTGEVLVDRFGLPMWEKDIYGRYIEDWSLLTRKERDDLLYTLVTSLFDWQQRAADAWSEAMMAKAQWEESYSRFFDQPLTGTVEGREAIGRVKSADERYFAIFLSAYSRKAEALVRSMERIANVLRDSLQAK